MRRILAVLAGLVLLTSEGAAQTSVTLPELAAKEGRHHGVAPSLTSGSAGADRFASGAPPSDDVATADGLKCKRSANLMKIAGMDIDLLNCMQTVDLQMTAQAAAAERVSHVRIEAERRLLTSDLDDIRAQIKAEREYWHQWCVGEKACE